MLKERIKGVITRRIIQSVNTPCPIIYDVMIIAKIRWTHENITHNIAYVQ